MRRKKACSHGSPESLRAFCMLCPPHRLKRIVVEEFRPHVFPYVEDGMRSIQRWVSSKGALVHSLELIKYFKGSGMPYHIEKYPPEFQQS